MKYRSAALILLLALLAAIFSGCSGGQTADGGQEQTEEIQTGEEQTGETQSEQTSPAPTPEAVPEATAEPENVQENGDEKEPDYAALYSGVTDSFYAMISGEDISLEGDTGVRETINGWADGGALENIGYGILDISSDGVPELLICIVEESEGGKYYGSEVCTVYTLDGEEPVCVLEGWARSCYCIKEDFSFSYYGSSGAASSAFGSFRLSPDGKELLCDSFYFTAPKGENFEEIAFYHNVTGEYNEEASKELEISDEEFWKILEETESGIKPISITPFSEYTSEQISFGGSSVYVYWADEENSSECEKFEAFSGEGAARVLFTSPVGAADFKLLSLTFADVDEEGNVKFETEELYSMDCLSAESPLEAAVGFFGTVPAYGISYTDENGETRCFALDLSGKDGSLLLWEF